MGSEEAEEGMRPTLMMYDDNDIISFLAMGVNQKTCRGTGRPVQRRSDRSIRKPRINDHF